MSITPTRTEEKPRPVKTILISQPPPKNKSPYDNLERKYGISVDFRSFIHVEGIAGKDFRKERINPTEYTAIIFTSRNSIEHFFRVCEEMRLKMSQDTRYFCTSEAIAHYLQKFIVYRKRKVFYGARLISDLKDALLKYKKEKFLMPCSNLRKKSVSGFVASLGIELQEAEMYRTVASDLSDLADITYDMLVFFSPLGIESLYKNFPSFEQNHTRIAAFGPTTCKAVLDRNLEINVKAPLPEAPSMTMAIDRYLKKANS